MAIYIIVNNSLLSPIFRRCSGIYSDFGDWDPAAGCEWFRDLACDIHNESTRQPNR